MSANRIAPDGTPRFAAWHLGLICLTMSHKKDARLIWVKVAEWLPFGELPLRLTVCSLCNLFICGLSYFPFRSEGKISDLVVQVSGYYLAFTLHKKYTLFLIQYQYSMLISENIMLC